MEMDNDDLDEDIERLKIILQDENEDEGGESDGELRVLENQEEEYYSNASRPTTSSDITASSFPTTSVCTDADESLFRFDPSTITAETCLAMNRAYQEVLLDTLRQIEISLIENRNRQKSLEESVDEKTKKTDKQTNKDPVFQESKYLPYFKDRTGTMPAYNEDVKLKEQMNEYKQHMKPKAGWTKTQRRKLIDAIKVDSLEHIIRPLLNKQEIEMEKLSRCKNGEDIGEVKERIEKIRDEIKQSQELPPEELLKRADSAKCDFMKISTFNFDGKFTPMECESMWNNVLRPGINRNKWTKDEEEELKKLASKYEMRDWKKIAGELGTNRTPFQCLQHYQQNNVVYDKSEWTDEEDELLKEVVDTCTGVTGLVHWYQVAYYIDRRSANQCRSRWLAVNPNRTIGRWTKMEDTQLLNAIQSFGEVVDWFKVQEHVPTRDAGQCRERYRNAWGGNLYFQPWTYEDDKRLLMLHDQMGDQWTKISEYFHKRNGNMILTRYKRLMKWQELMEGFYDQPRRVQRQLKHQAFKFGKHGMVVPKSGLRYRIGMTGRPVKMALARPETVKTELDKLKETGGKEAAAAHEELSELPEVKEEDTKGEMGEEDEDLNEPENKRVLQASLDVFINTYNILAEDYFKQLEDKLAGRIVVPRPPPMKRKGIHKVPSVWRKQNRLTDVVITQIDDYLYKLQDKIDEADANSVNTFNLYEQIARHVNIENETEKKKMILSAFGGRNPCQLSVRQLLNISRCMKENGKPPKNSLKYHEEPWELEDSDDDEEASESSSEEELEEPSEDEEPKPKKPKTEKQIAHFELLGKHMRKLHDLEAQIQRLVHVRMDPSEYCKARGRKKQFLMYPRKILAKYRGLDEERKLNRKSLVLLMKTLDIDAKKAYFKAKRGKRRLSAMAFLKSAERSNLRKARTRREKTKIQEAVQVEANMTSEINEASDFILDLREELRVTDEDEGVLIKEEPKDEDTVTIHYGYNKTLPFIPPNQTNLRGFRSLLLEHRLLIDQSGPYFNSEELKQNLYQLKQKGPNPLMGVLNAIGKTESISKKRKREKEKACLFDADECHRQLREVRETTAYQQLKARFQSMFTWPALMATIPAPKRKPLPKPLQDMVKEQPGKITASATASQKDVIVDNAEAGHGEVATQCEDLEEVDEDLPEEEAIEKLVDKIMAEYEKDRMKKKRKLPTTKKFRNFSEKRKQAFVEKERTKILKRLGLYEKMQEFKKRRLETEQGVAMAVATPSNKAVATATRSAEGDTEPMDVETITEQGESSGAGATATPNSTSISSEGCQADLPPDDVETAEVTVKSESILKRKRGRPHGSKTKCYSETTPLRKSQRATETPVIVKEEQDFEMSKPKKKTYRNKTGAQYSFVRNLIPEKMGKIASQIPDLPILNEPLKEKVQKLKKQKEKKPKLQGEKKRVVKSINSEKESVRILKLMQAKIRKEKAADGETEQNVQKEAVETTRASSEETITSTEVTSKPKVKTEPIDSDTPESENNFGNEDTHDISSNHVDVTEESEISTKKKIRKIVTARAQREIESEREKISSNADASEVAMATTSVESNEDHGVNRSPKNTMNDFQKSQTSSETTVSGNVQPKTEHSVDTPANYKIAAQEKVQQDTPPQDVRKALLVAVPVLIGGVQQVAMIPFYPDEEGKITLPNGKKIDANASQEGNTVSLPLVGFDHPIQVLNPGAQTMALDTSTQNQTISDTTSHGKEK